MRESSWQYPRPSHSRISPMSRQNSIRSNKAIRLLLGAPLFLWVFLLLHVLRLSTGFNWMVKHLTPYIVFGTMTLCPLAAAVLGWRMLKRNGSVAVSYTHLTLPT